LQSETDKHIRPVAVCNPLDARRQQQRIPALARRRRVIQVQVVQPAQIQPVNRRSRRALGLRQSNRHQQPATQQHRQNEKPFCPQIRKPNPRNPKEAPNPNSEPSRPTFEADWQIISRQPTGSDFCLRISFGPRPSDFGFNFHADLPSNRATQNRSRL
jgi:hypothetical protein